MPGFVVGTAAGAGLSKAQAARAEAMYAEWRATAFAQVKPPRFGLKIERRSGWSQPAVDPCAPDPRGRGRHDDAAGGTMVGAPLAAGSASASADLDGLHGDGCGGR